MPRLMMSRPSRCSAFARARTSKAVSVPSWLMRADIMGMVLFRRRGGCGRRLGARSAAHLSNLCSNTGSLVQQGVVAVQATATQAVAAKTIGSNHLAGGVTACGGEQHFLWGTRVTHGNHGNARRT